MCNWRWLLSELDLSSEGIWSCATSVFQGSLCLCSPRHAVNKLKWRFYAVKMILDKASIRRATIPVWIGSPTHVSLLIFTRYICTDWGSLYNWHCRYRHDVHLRRHGLEFHFWGCRTLPWLCTSMLSESQRQLYVLAAVAAHSTWVDFGLKWGSRPPGWTKGIFWQVKSTRLFISRRLTLSQMQNRLSLICYSGNSVSQMFEPLDFSPPLSAWPNVESLVMIYFEGSDSSAEVKPGDESHYNGHVCIQRHHTTIM